ncbi:pyridoxal phosphate-dependent aminotransferase [Jeotgalibacillus sp. ET6]|uniref:pyridoxal phosphate-dependent aminotransferase n=1 Tax=Jeotgalibacillus sp. ET6 TaxID=3037260 RepID=UPI002418552B|nr:pyridoxal phosphate-dependent aminotransferase [Jeotgalibacillus sp. ET6]MDG5470616.1 pyridoxal phosphate-dependent aminotransferase [Jeotgalibacillus sp. ET6]
MKNILADRVKALTPSTTLAITAKAKELKAEGKDVIGLGAGEPDYNTPDHIIEAAYESMKAGQTKYTPAAGMAELKKAIIDKFTRDQHITYSPAEVFVGSGAKHVLYCLLQAILNPDDEVIIPTPYWVSYPEQVKLADGRPVYIEGKEENQYKITPDQLSSAISDKTKAIIINSPSNPTGMIYSKSELEAIAEVCADQNILIISDEIYEKLTYEGQRHVSVASISETFKQQSIIVNGVSKSHSMTGWRIGYAAGEESIIKAMTNLASHSTSNPTTTAQFGALAAYQGTQEPVEEMRKAFENRLNKVFSSLQDIPGFRCIKPQGAFYLFPNVKEAALACGFETVDEFVADLLEKANVAVIPGSGFGADDNIRLSYATDLSSLEEAIRRIHVYVNEQSQSGN